MAIPHDAVPSRALAFGRFFFSREELGRSFLSLDRAEGSGSRFSLSLAMVMLLCAFLEVGAARRDEGFRLESRGT